MKYACRVFRHSDGVSRPTVSEFEVDVDFATKAPAHVLPVDLEEGDGVQDLPIYKFNAVDQIGYVIMDVPG